MGDVPPSPRVMEYLMTVSSRDAVAAARKNSMYSACWDIFIYIKHDIFYYVSRI